MDSPAEAEEAGELATVIAPTLYRGLPPSA